MRATVSGAVRGPGFYQRVAQKRAAFVRELDLLRGFNDLTQKALQVLEEPFKQQLKEYIQESCVPARPASDSSEEEKPSSSGIRRE